MLIDFQPNLWYTIYRDKERDRTRQSSIAKLSRPKTFQNLPFTNNLLRADKLVKTEKEVNNDKQRFLQCSGKS